MFKIKKNILAYYYQILESYIAPYFQIFKLQVGEVDTDEGTNTAIDTLTKAVDGYLLELAEKDELSVEELCQLVSALPADRRSSHDILYKVVETLLKSGRGYSI